MTPEAAATRVVQHTLARPPTLGAGRLVCVDGPAGSGKTSLADAVARRTDAQPSCEPVEDETAVMAEPRFLTLADVAEVLNISQSQVYALVRNNELAAIKIGGRGQWRVESTQLEEFIQRMYTETRTFVDEHPFVEAEPEA